MSLVYCFLDNKGRPVYVGKTTMPLKARIRNHVALAKRKPVLDFHKWLAVNEYKVIILDKVPYENLAKCETRWMRRLIKRYKLLNMRLYSNGGVGCGRVKWTPEYINLLGKQTDGSIAKLLNCDRGSVAYKRSILGIKRFPDPHNVPSTIYLSPETISKLGKLPDYVIANEIGVSKFVIAKHRKRLGIKSYADVTGNNGRVKIGDVHWRHRKK